MAYHKQLPWIKQWRRGMAKDDFKCMKCGEIIHSSQERVALKKDKTFCYHTNCWDSEEFSKTRLFTWQDVEKSYIGK